MNPVEIKAAFRQKDVPKPFLIYKDSKQPKLVLVIGMTVKFEAARIKTDTTLKSEGMGVCHATEDDKVIFHAKQPALTLAAKTAIKVYCKAAAYEDVRFRDDAGEEPATAAPGTDGATLPAANPAQAVPTPVSTPPPAVNPVTAQQSGTFGSGTTPVPVPQRTPPPNVPPRSTPPANTPILSTPPPNIPLPTTPSTGVRPRAAAPTSAPPASTQFPRTPPVVPARNPSTAGTSTTGTSTASTPPAAPNASSVARTGQKRTFPTAVPALPSTARVDLAATYSPQNLAAVKKNASRLGMKMGAFDAVFDGMSSVAGDGNQLAQLSGANPPNPKQLGDARGAMLKKYADLLTTLKGYDNEKVGPTVSDSMRQARTDFRNQAEVAINKAIGQIRYDQRADVLKFLTAKNNQGGLTDKEDALYQEKRAELLLMSTGGHRDRAAGGSGETVLLRDASGKVAYAFKSIAGESDQMRAQGIVKGTATAQEILTSKMSDVLEAQCGFKSGHPKTTLAKLPISDAGGEANVGALIEGLSGYAPEFIAPELTEQWERMDPAQQRQIEQEIKAADARAGTTVWDDDYPDTGYGKYMVKKQRDQIRNIPAKDVQKVLLINLATVNYDSKWESVMIDGQGCRPFDGGAAMTSVGELQKRSTDRTGAVDPVLGDALLFVPPGVREAHPAASAPLDQEFVDQFKDLDLDKVREEMTGAVVSLQGSDPVLKDAISVSNVESSLKSLEFIKSAISENPRATTAEFLKSYQAKMKTWVESTAARQ